MGVIEIVDSIWFSLKLPVFGYWQIGIVAGRLKVTGEIKMYIGMGMGIDQKEDEQRILERGVPFYPISVISWLMQYVNELEKGQENENSGASV